MLTIHSKPDGNQSKLTVCISQRFVTSTGNMEVLLYNAHSIVCASSYFDPKKYSLMPKLAFFQCRCFKKEPETLIDI